MLKSLHISNYALINALKINFESGMNVLTGETGAGKSIIVGALSLVMGQRADTKIIKEGEQKTVVEAEFDVSNYRLQPFFDANELDYANHTFIRREVTAGGKSRAFVNDTPVQLSILKELSNRLIDIHSQHENLLLTTENYQLHVVDATAGNETEQTAYQQAFTAWNRAKHFFQQLKQEAEKQQEDLDYVRFQLNLLDESELIENEQVELEVELETLSHVEEIKTELQRAEHLFESEESNALSAVREIRNAMQKISAYLPESADWAERLESLFIELKDIASAVSSAQQQVEFDPQRLEFIDSRLANIYALQKKFKLDSVEELIQQRERFRAQLERIDNMDEELANAEKQVAQCAERLKTAAEKLSASRREAVSPIENQIAGKLRHLGMPDIRFAVSISSTDEFTPAGTDQIVFLFSANKNRSMQPVAEIASGGEISRLMLAIKSMLVTQSALPTIIFDEIDSGVSGDIAGRMGDIMQSMSQTTQVFVITHLPQIAAKGTTHFRVYKDHTGAETETHIKRLAPDERVQEIAQMLSGKQVTEAALMNAADLMR